MSRRSLKGAQGGCSQLLQATAILVLLAACCSAQQQGSLVSTPAASGSSLAAAAPSHSHKWHLAGHAASRVPLQQAQEGIVGDEDEFDWVAEPTPAQPQPQGSKPQQLAPPTRPAAQERKPAASTAAEAAKRDPQPRPDADAEERPAEAAPHAEQQPSTQHPVAGQGDDGEDGEPVGMLPDGPQLRKEATKPAQQDAGREADMQEEDGPAAAASRADPEDPRAQAAPDSHRVDAEHEQRRPDEDRPDRAAEGREERRTDAQRADRQAVAEREQPRPHADRQPDAERADATAEAEESEKLAADAAAAAELDAEEPEPQVQPVRDGAPAVLGDHTVPAAAQTRPGGQQQQGSEPGQGSEDREAEKQGSGTWVAAAAGQAAPKQGDVDPTGACKSWVQRYCEDVEPREGHLADCLAQYQAAADAQEGNGKLEPLSDDCHEEVMQLKIWRSKSLDSNPALAKACAEDIDRYCSAAPPEERTASSVVACLKGAHAARVALQPACKKEVFKLQLDAAEDYRADEVLHKACVEDAKELCKGVKHGGGQIQACLRKQQDKLSSQCEAQLFRKEAEDADDIRLSVRLFRACLPDKKAFCADVPPGQARVSQCLEEHREALSEPCRAEVDAMLERRVRDFRLDSRLRTACQSTIPKLCDMGDDSIGDALDAAVANCLQDFRDSITDEACKAVVHKYQELAAQDIRFNPSLADACYQDRNDLCANVPPGSARVIRCLQNQRDKLSSVCRSTLMSEEVKFSENIDFQYPMKQACAKEVEQFCDVVPHGGGRVIRCLQGNMKQKGFSRGCRDEVLRYEQESARDYRLNHRLYTACNRDVGAICLEACDVQQGEVCGGKVLACLADRQEDIKSSACRKEVSYLQRMGVQDFRTDMQLAEACRPDVERFCKTVEPGAGRVHNCLRENYGQLSPACRREEVRLEAQEADNIQLNQGLMRTCVAERSLFCSDVRPGSARVFRCLAHSMANADFGGPCRSAMLTKLRRREANWRLDPPLRKACKADVESLCAEQDASLSQDGAVKKCMVDRADSLSDGCRRELGRSLYMAFFVWQPQSLLTAPCDADVQWLCLSRVKEMDAMPGAVEVCLSEIVDAMAATQTNHRRLLAADSEPSNERRDPSKQQRQSGPGHLPSGNSTGRSLPRLSEECYRLAALAHLPQYERSPDFAAAAYSLLQGSLGRVQDATGLQTLWQDSTTGQVAVSLTGWTALAGVASLVVLLMTVATWALRQYTTSPSRNGYSVVKNVPPLPRV